MNDSLQSLLDMKPNLGLMFGLNVSIWLLKKSAPIPGWIIPWLAIVVATGVYPLISDIGSQPYTMRSPLTGQLLTGFIIGCASIGTNQWAIRTLQKLGFWDEDKPEPPKPSNP